MRIITSLLLSLLLLGCTCPLSRKVASRAVAAASSPQKKPSPQIVGTFLPKRDKDLGTPEQIKAYRLGRSVDPADPNTLHEAHTIYRREQAAHWNLAAASGTRASRSYYLNADQSQQDQQQRAYFEAAQEQACIAQEKLTISEKKIADLEKENTALKERTKSPLL